MKTESKMFRRQFDKFILAVAENFNTEIAPTRLDLYWNALGPYFENESLNKLYATIIRSCKFFPTPAEMLELSGKAPVTQRKKAEDWIDEAIFLMTYKSGEAYELMGAQNYRYAKSIGMDPYGLKTGQQNPAFHRGKWAEKLERDWAKAENPAQLEEHDAGAFFRELEQRTENQAQLGQGK